MFVRHGSNCCTGNVRSIRWYGKKQQRKWTKTCAPQLHSFDQNLHASSHRRLLHLRRMGFLWLVMHNLHQRMKYVRNWTVLCIGRCFLFRIFLLVHLDYQVFSRQNLRCASRFRGVPFRTSLFVFRMDITCHALWYLVIPPSGLPTHCVTFMDATKNLTAMR